jgi:hypothetical protein
VVNIQEFKGIVRGELISDEVDIGEIVKADVHDPDGGVK